MCEKISVIFDVLTDDIVNFPEYTKKFCNFFNNGSRGSKTETLHTMTYTPETRQKSH